MSFSLYLNSIDGTRVNGNVTEIQYNFDFLATPQHNGGYKVNMTFASEKQPHIGAFLNFGLVNIDLGVVSNSYSTSSTSTSAANNQVFGIIRLGDPEMETTNAVPIVVSTGTAPVPVNSGTAAYTLTTTTTTPAYNITYVASNTAEAYYGDNPPFFIQGKPRNNQFIVRLTNSNGTPFTALTVEYGIILTFEAI